MLDVVIVGGWGYTGASRVAIGKGKPFLRESVMWSMVKYIFPGDIHILIVFLASDRVVVMANNSQPRRQSSTV